MLIEELRAAATAQHARVALGLTSAVAGNVLAAGRESGQKTAFSAEPDLRNWGENPSKSRPVPAGNSFAVNQNIFAIACSADLPSIHG